MILPALKEYYDRKAADPASEMAPPGFEWKEIPFIIVLKPDGTPVGFEQTYEREGKKRRAKRFLVPQAVKKTSRIAANLFWDNPEYVLGITLKGNPERVCKQHADFKRRINELGDVDDDGYAAVKGFLAKVDKEQVLQGFGEAWSILLKEGGNLTFRLAGDNSIVLERPVLKSAIEEVYAGNDKGNQGICLVTGKKDAIVRTHAPIQGVYGAQTSGGNIVSFNQDAFRSYNKKQGANSPVGKTAVFAYTTALNHLLGKDSKQRMQVGDASTVFWAEKNVAFEQQFAHFFGEPPKDDPDRCVRAVSSLFGSIDTGAFHADESEKNRFFVLGLAPNTSRLAIRFWIVDSVAGMAENICQHFKDTEIVPPWGNKHPWPRFHSVGALLATSANEIKYDTNKPNLVYNRGKYFDVNPNLAAQTVRAILEGLPYPQTLLQAALRRIRAEHEIPFPRAACVKAYINRLTRFKNSNVKEELKMSLDENNTNIGYRLGRLFAALEKIQKTANPGINATIRDRFYGAASGTPVTVFGNLMRLKNHHLAKMANPGRRVYFEKLLGRIIGEIDAKGGFPTHLSLEDQGRFAIGYYHQMQDFYTR